MLRRLQETHPPPAQDLHADVYAEKAWALLVRSTEKELTRTCFERAIALEPNRVEWYTSYVLWLIKPFEYKQLEDHLMEKLREAAERDPDNTHLASHYLIQRAMRGADCQEEAEALLKRIKAAPVGLYSGVKALLWIFTEYISVHEAMGLAEMFLEDNPEQHYMLMCAAQWYKVVLLYKGASFQRESLENIRQRAVQIHRDWINRYPASSVPAILSLTQIYATFDLNKVEQLLEEFKSKITPEMKQKLYNRCAYILHTNCRDNVRSMEYHQKVLEIPTRSRWYEQSYRIVAKWRLRNGVPQ